MNAIILTKLLIDFGLVVLIWMVQIIIYPSFLHYTSEKLSVWHPLYTRKITSIVAPLMVAQLGLSVYIMVTQQTYSLFEIIDLLLIATNWLLTMLVFISLHEKIDLDSTDRDIQTKLVKYNWVRVILFCSIFMFNVIHICKYLN
ncbi:hypothetical protein LY01_02306 [Nonlabens xylanidelens]|uniref:DUF4149 domain-containing protein n=1 Tax=Nonlabens xylanidelens TaxID=191564 RepID=A0A2S6IIN0_9FLAO|nr:hypothetical protein [Nonlabens xylanidelens]PPK94084.1 hypothetical protein LY01_02306 [Nonlabens xylanidelens]PQJ22235.1 hypothetical protein BST94_01250 [Nonlabens xylanidelens]